MNLDLLLGIGVILGSTVLMLVLYAWSVRRIETIHAKKLSSLRTIEREFGKKRGGND